MKTGFIDMKTAQRRVNRNRQTEMHNYHQALLEDMGQAAIFITRHDAIVQTWAECRGTTWDDAAIELQCDGQFEAITCEVNSAESATTFLRGLRDAGLLYHPDDDLRDCLRHHLLHNSLIDLIDRNMLACFTHLPDVYETVLDLVDQ